GGLLGLMVIIIGSLLALSKNRVKAALIAGLVCLAVLTFSGGRIKNYDNKEASANARFEIWDEGLVMFASRPLTGIGYNQFPNRSQSGFNAHNTLVVCFVELGLLGYFFWIGCFYYCFRRRARGDVEHVE